MRDEWERDRSVGHGRGPDRGARGERGVPDALLLGILGQGFLLGATVLAWSATGLAGRFAHGAWPENVTFGHTPLAVRHLFGNPQDLAGAWPETPAGQLSGYGLFWGLFIGQLMVLVVLTVFVVGTFTRWRAVRRARRFEAARPPSGVRPPRPRPCPRPAHRPPGLRRTVLRRTRLRCTRLRCVRCRGTNRR
ncbi:hypothetical protein SALBM135S_03109 [Streptomyces alboniger]